MQSDKHLNNMQELSNSQNLNNTTPLTATGPSNPSGTQNSDSPKMLLPSLQQSNQSSGQPTSSSAISNASTSSSKPKASFRCTVCSYETSVQRNLRIHWTSEKHTHNVAVLENNFKHLQALGFLQQQSQAAAGLVGGISQLAGTQNLPGLTNMQSFLPEAALADLAYNQALMFQLLQHRSSTAAAIGGNSPSVTPNPLAAAAAVASATTSTSSSSKSSNVVQQNASVALMTAAASSQCKY